MNKLGTVLQEIFLSNLWCVFEVLLLILPSSCLTLYLTPFIFIARVLLSLIMSSIAPDCHLIFCVSFLLFPLVVERASVTVGEPTSYDTTVGTFGELGRALTDDISKVFQQTGIPTGEDWEHG